MLNNKEKNIVILGGGVFGFSAAYHLAKEGYTPLVIEMDSIAAKASGKADGMIADALGAFFYAGSKYCAGGIKKCMMPFMVEGYQLMQSLSGELKEEGGLDIHYALSKFYKCALSDLEEKRMNDVAGDARQAGLSIEIISGKELRNIEEAASSEVQSAIVSNCAQVEPYRYTLALAQAAEKRGATIRNAQAIGFQLQGKRVKSIILSNGKEVPADQVIIAMGPWSRDALTWLGFQMPVIAFAAETLKLTSSHKFQHQLSFVPPVKQEWPHTYILFSPRVDGTLFVGYTENHPASWDNNDSQTWTDTPNPEIRDLILEHAIRFIPMLEEASLVEHRAAVLANPSVEGLVIGPIPQWENVLMATAGDNGICISPVVGHLLTDLIVGGERANKALNKIKMVHPANVLGIK